MDIIGLLIVFGLATFGGLFGALLGSVFLNGFYWTKLIHIERQVNAAWGAQASQKGVAAREDAAAEWEAATTEALAIAANKEMKPEQKLLQVGALALKYPKAGSKIAREVKKMGIMDALGGK